MPSTKDFKIMDLLDHLENGYMAVPEIQRSYVWPNSKVRDFVDSLYKDYPVGMILTWAIEPEDSYEFTPISDHLPSKQTKWKELVIDGQQRLTALYLATRGKIKKKGKEKTINLYFDVIDENFILHRSGVVPTRMFEVLDVVNSKSSAIILKDIINQLATESGLSETEAWMLFSVKLDRLRSCLTTNPIPVMQIPSAFDYDDVATIFERVNTTGKPLSRTQVLVALATLRLPGTFKNDLHNFISKMDKKGLKFSVGIIMKILMALATSDVNIKGFSRFLRDSKNKPKLSKAWKEAKKYTEMAQESLRTNIGISTTKYIASVVPMVPLVYYLRHRKGKTTDSQKRKLMTWFLQANFENRYLGSQETKLKTDIDHILSDRPTTSSSGSLDSMFSELKKPTLGRSDFETSFRNKGAVLLLYATTHDKKAVDWLEGNPISDSNIELHHIFPQSLLADNYDADEIDDIANLAFLTPNSNKVYSSRAPSDYLLTIQKKRLRSQFIPLDPHLYDLKQFPKFLEERRTLLVSAVEKYLKKMRK